MVPFNSCISFAGQDKCFPCPAGFHCSKGLRRRCPPGFYCPQKTGVSFYPCPPGSYNPSYGLSQAERCQQCPAGEKMTECSDCSCRAVSKRVISLRISFPNPLMCVSPLGNASMKIPSQRSFPVPLVVSPSEPQGFFWRSAEEFGLHSGFPRVEHDLSWNAVLSQLCWCWRVGTLRVFPFAFQSVHVVQQLFCFFPQFTDILFPLWSSRNVLWRMGIIISKWSLLARILLHSRYWM